MNFHNCNSGFKVQLLFSSHGLPLLLKSSLSSSMLIPYLRQLGIENAHTLLSDSGDAERKFLDLVHLKEMGFV